jgi:CHAD domain-containing protein
MAFRIDPEDASGEPLKQAVREQAEKARLALRERPEGDAEAVHDARKRFKKIRSALRLVRPALGPAYKRENARWRDAGRRLEAARDAAALAETAASARRLCAESVEDALFDAVEAALTRRREAAERGLDGRIRQTLKDVEAGLRALDGLDVEGAAPLWRSGLKKTYGRGRDAFRGCRAMEAAGAPVDPALWHDWRKRAKHHRLHMRLLRPLWKDEMKAREDRAGALGDALGAERDFMLLIEALEPAPKGLDAAAARDLRAVLEARRERFRSDALRLGAALYAETPKALARRCDRYREAA